MNRWVMLVAACLLTACAASAERGDDERVDDVVRGARDRGRHPAVVAIRTRAGELCTGALVAPRLVLTARHCVSATVDFIDCSARRQVLGDLPAASLRVVTDEDALRGPTAAYVARVVVPAGRRLCGADAAVLVLDRALTEIAPLAVDDRALPREGDAVTVVGYGLRGDSPRAGVGLRYTRSGVRVVAVRDDEVVTGEGTCGGDSGSPLLDARTGRIVGVLSRGSDRCVGGDSLAVWTRASVAQRLIDAAR
jgi:hypothetical protein